MIKQRDNYSVIKTPLTHRFCTVSHCASGHGFTQKEDTIPNSARELIDARVNLTNIWTFLKYFKFYHNSFTQKYLYWQILVLILKLISWYLLYYSETFSIFGHFLKYFQFFTANLILNDSIGACTFSHPIKNCGICLR